MFDANIPDSIIRDIKDEYYRATKKFKAFNSAHEGISIINEERDELWDEIKGDQNPANMRLEAIQVATMAIRFIMDVC